MLLTVLHFVHQGLRPIVPTRCRRMPWSTLRMESAKICIVATNRILHVTLARDHGRRMLINWTEEPLGISRKNVRTFLTLQRISLFHRFCRVLLRLATDQTRLHVILIALFLIQVVTWCQKAGWLDSVGSSICLNRSSFETLQVDSS